MNDKKERGMPGFLINGFLEAGKTKFISFTLQQEYFKAETLAITTAEGQLQKAKTFKERQYWYEKMEQHTAALGSHNDTVLYMVIGLSLAGLILCCCPKRGIAYGK